MSFELVRFLGVQLSELSLLTIGGHLYLSFVMDTVAEVPACVRTTRLF